MYKNELKRGYGAGTVAGILHGSRVSKLLDWGLDQLESYGCQAEVSEPRLKEIIQELIAQGYLTTTPDKYALLGLTSQAETIRPACHEILQTKREDSCKTKKSEKARAANWILPPGSCLNGCVRCA